MWVKGGEGEDPWLLRVSEVPLLSVRARTGGDVQGSFSVTKCKMKWSHREAETTPVHSQSRRTEGSVAAARCPCTPCRLRHIFQVVLL